jgi:hypothetical protein
MWGWGQKPERLGVLELSRSNILRIVVGDEGPRGHVPGDNFFKSQFADNHSNMVHSSVRFFTFRNQSLDTVGVGLTI